MTLKEIFVLSGVALAVAFPVAYKFVKIRWAKTIGLYTAWRTPVSELDETQWLVIVRNVDPKYFKKINEFRTRDPDLRGLSFAAIAAIMEECK